MGDHRRPESEGVAALSKSMNSGEPIKELMTTTLYNEAEAMRLFKLEGLEEGWEESLLSSLKSLMKKLKLTVEQAMDMLDVPPESRKALAVKLNNDNP